MTKCSYFFTLILCLSFFDVNITSAKVHTVTSTYGGYSAGDTNYVGSLAQITKEKLVPGDTLTFAENITEIVLTSNITLRNVTNGKLTILGNGITITTSNNKKFSSYYSSNGAADTTIIKDVHFKDISFESSKNPYLYVENCKFSSSTSNEITCIAARKGPNISTIQLFKGCLFSGNVKITANAGINTEDDTSSGPSHLFALFPALL